jgi:hypothetical protein
MGDWLSAVTPLRFDLDQSGRVLTATLPAQPAPDLERWGLLLAEALHAHRSALNGLVSQLARLDGGEPRKPKRVQFPITRSEKEWEDAAKDMESLPSVVLDRLRSTQPFVNPPSPHMLELISGLDNPTKHDGVIIEVHALPLELSATGLSILTEGGNEMRMKMWAGPIDFATDLEVASWEFSKPVQTGTQKPDSKFGLELLTDFEGTTVNLLDLIEGPPIVVGAIFSLLLTGTLPAGYTEAPGESPEK